MTASTPEISSPPADVTAAHTTVRLEPPESWQPIDLAELWRYRELTWLLAVRDIKVRYKQTLLGAAWAVIQPLMTALIFTFINVLAGSSLSAGDSSRHVPYLVWTFCAMLPWQLFENSITQASNSLVGSQNLITKVYFPRLSIPISSIVAGLPDFGIGLLVLAGMMAWWHVAPGWGLLALPLFAGLALLAALAAGLWLSALNVQYRDVRYAIPFLARFWFFATPVIYPASKVGEKWGPKWQAAYGLNPMAGVVEGFRWALLGTPPPAVGLLVVSAGAMVALLVGGLYYFRRMEQTFADVV